MRSCAPLVFVALALALPVGTLAENEESPPPWAYPVNPPDWKPGPDDGSIRRVPESTAGFTLTQLRDLFLAPDWHPGDHPPMPEVVARGRKPDVMACGVCHRADGPGGPENSSLAGLPKAYIVRQMTDFKSGARTTSVPERLPSKLMIALSKGATDAEVDAAAGYFSALKQRANIRVLDEAERRKADRRRHGDARRIRRVVGAVISSCCAQGEAYYSRFASAAPKAFEALSHQPIDAGLTTRGPIKGETRQPLRRATDEVRADDQPQDRQGARPHDTAVAFGARGPGHRVNRSAFLASTIPSLATPLVRPIFGTQGPCRWIAHSSRGKR